MTRRAACAPAVLAVLLTVSACGGSDDSDTAATSPSASSSSSTATASPSASASASTSTGSGTQAGPAIVAAANAFLQSLSDAERNTVQFDSGDTTAKQNWSNLPNGLYEWKGLKTGDLDDTKLNAGLAVLKVILSEEGYDRVVAEWTADDQLAGGSGGGPGGGLSYGRDNYFFAIVGEPSDTASWQFRFGGHHVTVNATVEGNELSLTPSFIGAQPMEYDSNGTAVRVLGDIEDEAFALVNSLDATSRAKAVLGSSPIDLVLGPGQDGRTIQAEGLPGSAMSAEQQSAFLQLIDEYGGLANSEDGATREAQLQADLATTTFAWYGPTTAGSAAYFRITGPHVVIEYSPQSMGGDAANHIHGIYRDPTNDYGGTVS